MAQEEKKFLVALLKTANTPSTSFHKYVKSLDGYIDVENLRDGFYKANNYEQNDIMLVLKPTGLSPNSNHSTYSTEILGEVIGVPDVKLDAREVMPKEMAIRLAGQPRTRVSQSIAPYGVGLRKVEPPKRKRKQQIERRTKTIQDVAVSFNMDDQGFSNPMVDEYQFRKSCRSIRIYST